MTFGSMKQDSGESDAVDWRARLAIALTVFVLRLLSLTWRYRVIDRVQCNEERAAGHPVIFCLWHGQMLPLLAEHARPSTVLVSEHRDGEIISRVIAYFGLKTVRGSSSKGATRALLALVQEVRNGGDVAITPDGPRGPRPTFAPGALVVAQRSGMAIVPLGCHVTRAWRLKSWDQFEIPKPFARVVVVYGAPEHVQAASARDAARETARFTALMHDMSRQAEQELQMEPVVI
jgi:lysophospholipid acyltransferase (LPLAT)-like uncharacterized protein